ncbi:hypothetical protein BpHYR1_017769 [Brachionus plicatilis]|uniref:Uncharacterized protein n=1 Tax=Brachionus plicatilis TaxID=10195 RepID=A0A3M7PFN9_BRAPC|nr:hypothetical protein BpHYR1_017769 [Brachionus plicatilis]
MNKLKGFIDSKLFAKTGQECEPQAFVVACDKVFAKQDMENDAS